MKKQFMNTNMYHKTSGILLAMAVVLVAGYPSQTEAAAQEEHGGGKTEEAASKPAGGEKRC